MRWPAAALGDVARIERRGVAASSIEDGTWYVGLENIERGGKLVGVSRISAGDLGSAKFKFEGHHVLFGKLRPYLAKVARPSFAGVCSTDILPIAPGPRLDRDYLAHFLALPQTVALATSHSSGANLPRLSPSELAKFELPLPPIEEQRRIADILNQVGALVTKAGETSACFDELAEAEFIQMFGDPLRNRLGLPTTTVGDIALQVTDGEHQTPKREDHGVMLLSARNVQDGYLDLAKVDYIGHQEFARIRRRCEPASGDILISCSGTIGRVCQVRGEPPFALVRSVALVRPDPVYVTSTFLEHQLRQRTIKALMIRRANASSQANLFQGQIRPLPLLLPRLEAQHAFDLKIEAIERARRSCSERSRVVAELFASVQQRAFCGLL
jgi:type I restriction enzyme S subunit